VVLQTVDPRDAVVDVARGTGASLIVMGSRRLGGVAHWEASAGGW
jgi:nucleotide-binding universal stress UspA family protein